VEMIVTIFTYHFDLFQTCSWWIPSSCQFIPLVSDLFKQTFLCCGWFWWRTRCVPNGKS